MQFPNCSCIVKLMWTYVAVFLSTCVTRRMGIENETKTPWKTDACACKLASLVLLFFGHFEIRKWLMFVSLWIVNCKIILRCESHQNNGMHNNVQLVLRSICIKDIFLSDCFSCLALNLVRVRLCIIIQTMCNDRKSICSVLYLYP